MSGIAPTVTLRDGQEIPRLGLGTWALRGKAAVDAVAAAIDLGYRLIDTATRYENEQAIGRAVAAASVPRGEMFVTTKLRGSDHGGERAVKALHESLDRFGFDYVDLCLIHWPLPSLDRYVETWQALVFAGEEGLARSIGVSNFTESQLDRLVRETGETPVVNQIELHPELAQVEMRRANAARGVLTEAWSPLGAGSGLLSHPIIVTLAEKHGRTPAQIVLRWHVELGVIPIPKSSDPNRMAENMAVFDFELEDGDMTTLGKLDVGRRLGGDPMTTVEL